VYAWSWTTDSRGSLWPERDDDPIPFSDNYSTWTDEFSNGGVDLGINNVQAGQDIEAQNPNGSGSVGGCGGILLFFLVSSSLNGCIRSVIKAFESINEAPPATVSHIGFQMRTVKGGKQVAGLLMLSGPAPKYGSVVTLWTSNPTARAFGPNGNTYVVVPEGAISQRFFVSTDRVQADTQVVVTAAKGLKTKSTSIVVLP
jgi:hypothetical protein